MAELMSLARIARTVEMIKESQERYDACLSIKMVEEMAETARAAHEYEQKCIDLLDDNKNLDHSNKVLREENAKLREDIVKERRIVDSVHLQKDALVRSNYELKEQLRTARSALENIRQRGTDVMNLSITCDAQCADDAIRTLGDAE